MTAAHPGFGEPPAPGFYPNVPEDIYRSWQAVNQSPLSVMLERSPAHGRWEWLNSKPTESKDLGQAIHCAMLEPNELETRFMFRPPGIDGRTGPGRAAMKELKEQCDAEGRIFIDPVKLKQEGAELMVHGIRDAVLEHHVALDLLTGEGHTEVSAVWEHTEFPLIGKMRADRLTEFEGWGTIVDVKSTRDASPRAFANAVVNYGYDIQAAYYLDGLDTLAPATRRFIIIAVEKEPPYGVACYELDSVFIDYGRQRYMQALRIWAECEKTGVWPGYPIGLSVLEAPEWVASRLEVLE